MHREAVTLNVSCNSKLVGRKPTFVEFWITTIITLKYNKKGCTFQT